MKRILYTLTLPALIGFAGLARAQTPETSVPGDALLTYCAANTSFDAQYISSVKVGSIYHITSWSPGGYSDYTALVTTMSVDTAYPVTVVKGYGYSSDQCAIWVDWNKDTDFTDAGEQFTVSGTPGIGPYTATITPPAGTTAGPTRLRIRISNSGSFNSCGTTSYGETEDYTINIGGAEPSADVGVIDLIKPVTGINFGATDTIKVRVYNFGTAAQTNFPVAYQVNGGQIVTDSVKTSIAPGTWLDFSFAQMANLSIVGKSYSIVANTSLAGDQDTSNDMINHTVFHAWPPNQKVVQGEYFINTDPGEGNGTPVTGTYNLVDVLVNLTNLTLPPGSAVYLRFMSQNGKWSFPRSFKRENYLPGTNSNLNYCEYFINSDPGRGNGIEVPVIGGNITISDLNVPGGSTIYFRTRDSYNRWSQPNGIRWTGAFNIQGASLQNGEYFINSDPGKGNGTPLIFTSGVANITNLNLPVGSVVYVRVKDNYNRWSKPLGYKRPAVIPTSGSSLQAVEYFVNTDPGQGDGIPLTISAGAVNINGLVLHKNDVLYVRAKDSYNRWGPPRAWKYKFKDFQQAAYKVKLESNGSTTMPLPMQLNAPPDSTCGWQGIKNSLAWHANDTVLVRFQDMDGFYTSWKRGVIADAGPDDTICEGGYATLTAHGGTSYLWNNGMTGPTIQISPPVTTKYWVLVSDGAGGSSVDTAKVIVNPLPSQAGIIAGAADVCAGTTQTVYTVLVIQNAVSYHWILPAGCNGTSSTNSIQVTYPVGSSSGNILVNGINSCGVGSASSKPVEVQTAPPGPAGSITGQTLLCQGATNIIYSIEELSNATSYQWTIPASAFGSSNTTQISLNYPYAIPSGTISVKGNNSCGMGAASGLGIVVDMAPLAAGPVSGPATVSPGQTNVNYSTGAIPGSTGYHWTLPSGAAITAGDNTSSITVSYSGVAISGTLSVYGTNLCGNGPVSPALNITVTGSVPLQLQISNVTISNGVSNCYNATQTITVAGLGNQFLVQNGGSATLIAGHNIFMLPGTKVDPGGYLNGSITTGNDYCSFPVPAKELVSSKMFSDSIARTDWMQGSNKFFKIFPNPTDGLVTMEFTDIQNHTALSITIYNLIGEPVFDKEFDRTEKTVFSLGNLPNGIYLVSITQGGTRQFVRIIKQ